jgi:hypothetical protein
VRAVDDVLLRRRGDVRRILEQYRVPIQ